MPLEKYQESLSLGRLYRAGRILNLEYLHPQGLPNIGIDSGTINVYGSQSPTQPASISAMTLNAENSGVSGINSFQVVPKWIAFTQASGTTTEIISFGIEVSDEGSIS